MVSMENVSLEGNEEKYVTYQSVEALVRNARVRHSEHIRKYPPRYDPVFGAARK